MAWLIRRGALASCLCCGTLAGAAAVAAAPEIALDSGLVVALFDVLLEPETGVARFRYVAPAIGTPGFGYADVAGDLQHLCEVHALPALAAHGWEPREVVVSLSEREVAFGEATDALQYFEPFRVEGSACLREDF